MNSDLLKGGIETLKVLLNILDQLVQKLGSFGTIGLGVGIFEMFKHRNGISFILKELSAFGSLASEAWSAGGKLSTRFKDIGKAAGMAGSSIGGKLTGSISGMVGAIGIAVAAIGLIYNQYKKAKEAAAEARQEAIATSDEFINAAGSFEQAYIKYSGKTSLTSDEEAELTSAIQGTVDALGDKSSALTNIINSNNDYLDSLEQIAQAELKAADNAAQTKLINSKKELEEVAFGWEKFDGSSVDVNFGTSPSEEVKKIAEEVGSEYWNPLNRANRYVYSFTLETDASTEEIVDYYNTLIEYRDRLQDAGLENTDAYDNTVTTIDKMSEAVKVYTEGVYDAAKAQYQLANGIPKTVEEYLKMRDAILSDMKNSGSTVSTRKEIANSLDTEYNQMFDLTTNKIQSRKLIGVLDEFGDNESIQMEAFLDMRTAINNDECSVSDYISQFDNINKMTEGWSDEAKEELKLSFGLDTDTVKKQYDDLLEELPEKIGNKTAKEFLGGLSKDELSAVYSLKAEIDWVNDSPSEILAQVEEQARLNKAILFTFSIDVQTEGIEALNTAISEARSATGLTSESLTLLKNRYEDLDGFNAAALFEETALGVRLNNEELARLESQYENVNKLDIEKNLSALVTKYQELTDKIASCTDEQEKEKMQRQADSYADKIEELSTLSSMYDGLTSSFNKWQTALSSPNNGDNYDAVFDNFEKAKELYDGGLVGTDDFKTFAQLMTNEDLSNAGVDEFVSAYKNGLPVMKKYFTEGQKGCENFLNDISKLNSEWAHLNEDGNWEINFNAEDVAKELGISVDAVLLIADKLKDFGFEVKIDSSSLDNLQTEIEKKEAKLKELGQTPYSVDLTIKANSENLGKIETEIDKIKTYISEVNNNGSINIETKTALLDDARVKLEALITKKQEASQPAFMNLDTSQVNASLVDALEKVQSYQNAINELNKLNELKEAGITIDDSQLSTAKQKVDECAEAIQGLDGDVKVAIGLEEDGSIDSIKKAFEEGKVKIDADTDPAKTKIELLAKNVERIEDKDVTINVTVNGLDDVKELNRNIDLATNIDGDIDALSEYVESAKELSKLDDNITTYITANVEGNVLNTAEFKLDNLETFASGAKDLKGIGSFTTNVKANIDGNVIDTAEYKINNLKTFSESAKDVDNIGDVKSNVEANISGNVTSLFENQIDNLKVYSESASEVENIGDVKSNVEANISGNVTGMLEASIDNLKAYSDNAKDVNDIGDVKSSVEANINGNVKGMLEASIDNLKVYSESAKDIENIGDVSSSVEANINGNVTGMLEASIDNLKVYSDNAKDIDDIGDVSSKVTANIDGNVKNLFEEQIDNLKVYSESAKEIKNIGDVSSKVTANIDGNVIDTFEYKIDNLKTYADSAKNIDNIGDVTSSVEASVSGNVINTSEDKINSLKVYSDSAQKIDDIGDISSSVTADVNGNVIDTAEYKINNLKQYSDSAKDVDDIGNVTSSVTANVSGNVIDTAEYKINNLKEYSDSAKNVDSIGNVTSKVTANIDGNVIDTAEYKINNLKQYSDSAKDVDNIGKVVSSVTADVNGNVINTAEYKIDNLKIYGESAKKVKGIGDVSSSVTADVSGNVIKTSEEKIDNLGVFADSAKKVKNVGNFSSSVSANINGNITTNKTAVTDLEHFASIVSGMQNQTVTVSVTANVDSANVNSALTLLKDMSESGVFKNYTATIQVGAKIATIDDSIVQQYIATEKSASGKVKWSNDESIVNQFKNKIHEATGRVKWDDDTSKLKKSFTAKGTVNWTSGNNVSVKVLSNANGTANANGSTSSNAFARGNWGINGNGIALGGELGRELVVRDGKFFTIGDNGAEFFRYKKNDIVFNAAQTESLLKYGGIKGANPRGKMLATGSAYVEGNAFAVTGTGQFYNSVTGATYGSSSSDSNSKDKDKEFEEVIDWIEVIIDRVERAIDKFDKQANNIYKSWTSRNSALQSQISEVSKEISLQQQAYKKYTDAANAVGLSLAYIEKIQNGTIDIETINDETLKEKIDDYQKWYEASINAQKAIEELKETEASLYQQRFENVSTRYEGVLGTIEHEKNMLEEFINQSETQGWLVSYNYYRELSSNEKRNIAELEKQKADMLSELQTAMESGSIEIGSESWHRMCSAIDEVSLSLEEANTRVMEISQNAQQLKWKQFDLLQDKISFITDETEFLIELLSNDKLYEDNGKMTNSGLATMGQYGVAYNVLMQQADQAREEAERLQREKARALYNGTDTYDEDLEERYRELISLQREYILQAGQQKDAIRDMVEDGINLELDALQDLIDKKNEQLESEKDIYDYQKKVKKQTEEIAALEKQLSSYSSNTSEEAQSKIQELKVSLKDAKEELQETEYDRYISDQQKLLDELYDEYSEILNTRLDNLDALVEDMIVEINANATTISSTLSDKVDSVGYVLSDSMKTIWDSDTASTNNVITTYGEKFCSASTTTNNALNTINSNLQSMIAQLNAIAKTNVKSANISSAVNSKEANASTTKNSTSTSSSKKPSSQSSATSYPYGKASETTGNIRQGASGNQVKAIQYALNQLGYGNSGTKSVDGIFGSGTKSAVMSFQKAMGITADGIVGVNTRAKFKAKNYAVGKKNFSSDEIAWTQDGGKEFIVRPSDGAILTPIAKNDSILTSVASNNIWNMANSPAEFIRDNLNLGSADVPSNSTIQNSCVQNFDKIIFNMPNVHSYNEMLTQMQRDKNFENLITAMTIGRIAGGSSLAKGKSIR